MIDLNVIGHSMEFEDGASSAIVALTTITIRSVVSLNEKEAELTSLCRICIELFISTHFTNHCVTIHVSS